MVGTQTRLLLIGGALLVVGLILGVLLGHFFLPAEYREGSSEWRSSHGYTFVNPLLLCTDEAGVLPGEVRVMRSEIATTIDIARAKGDITEAAVYFRDLNNGPWFGINENLLFSPGSLLKVPVMIGILKTAENDPSIFTRTILLSERQAPSSIQRIVSADPLPLGQEYTVDRLLQAMIIDSDNDAIYLLDGILDTDLANRVYTDLGIKIPDGLAYEITVQQYASFFRILYNGTYVDPDLAEEALALLATTHYKDGLVGGVPKEVLVAHKFGERELTRGVEQLHDCGIVYAPGHPYTICVMTRGSSLEEQAALIRDISRIAYSHMNK